MENLLRLCLLLAVSISSAAGFSQDFELVGSPEEIVFDNLPNNQWVPDGHISLLNFKNNFMAWISAGPETYRMTGASISRMEASPITPISRRDYSKPSPENGGLWFYAVFQLSDQMISFYHAEDHLWEGAVSRERGIPIAYKTIGFATSFDDGVTWQKRGTILAAKEGKPAEPAWSGLGDHSAIRIGDYYYVYYSNHRIYLARSKTTANGLPTTWHKYHQGSFNEPGIGGDETSIISIPGGNPSVTFNSHIKKYVMVFQPWGENKNSIFRSMSEDGIHWDSPQPILKNNGSNRYRYATILSTDGDKVSGREAWLHYAYWETATTTKRQHFRQKIRFMK